MATTAVTASTSNTAATSTTAGSSTNSSTSSNTSTQNIVGLLNAGSGIDIKTLAQNLVAAEKAPRADLINKKLTKAEARISGIAAIKSGLLDLQTQLANLKKASTFGPTAATSSDTSTVGVSSTPAARTGTYDVAVSQLATSQRSVGSFATGADFGATPASISLSLTADPAKVANVTLAATSNNPQGLVDAINASTDAQALGISASLINTGTDVKVVISGATGQKNAFTISSSDTRVTNAFATPSPGNQSAQDANFTVNGIAVTRSTNSISDAINGLTLSLAGTTTSGTVTRISVGRDTSAITEKINAVVKSYNTLDDALNVLNDPKSTVDVYGGALAGDSLIRTVRSQVSQVLTLTGGTASATGTVRALRDIGLSLDKTGKLQLDTTKLNTALTQNYDQVVTMMTANSENTSVYSNSGGVASDSYNLLDSMLRTTGILSAQTQSAQTEATRYKDQLTQLDAQMTQLLDRYMKQFTVMDSLVSKSNALKTSLTSTFNSMSNNKN